MLDGRPGPLKIFASDKERLKLLFLAKHALAGGHPDAQDGTHAVYHFEMLQTMRAVGLDVGAANSFDAIYNAPQADFVVTLLNRAGFLNSEMLAPLLLTRRGIPFLGAGPIIRGLGDDKHLMKVVARHLRVPVTEWACVRRGQGTVELPPFSWERLVVKPNASSASWGVGVFDTWREAKAHAEEILASGHDVIMKPWAPLLDVAVPVIGAEGPWLLPAMDYFPDDLEHLRSYEEKRGLAPGAAEEDPLRLIEDAELERRLRSETAKLVRELWPFDYGRFEFRFDPATGDIRFMEVNLSCNLWSKKTISRSARSLGLSHGDLVETILAHSLMRQGVVAQVARVR